MDNYCVCSLPQLQSGLQNAKKTYVVPVLDLNKGKCARLRFCFCLWYLMVLMSSEGIKHSFAG